MEINVDVQFSDDVPEESRQGMALVGLVKAICGIAKELGISREQFIQEIPYFIDSFWDEEQDPVLGEEYDA